MWVQELSLGVDNCRRARWLSSGFTVSIIMWMLGCSSVDITQALTTHGTAVSLSWWHVRHVALSFSLHALRLRRLRIADHPETHRRTITANCNTRVSELGLDRYRTGTRYPILSAAAIPIQSCTNFFVLKMRFCAGYRCVQVIHVCGVYARKYGIGLKL